VTRVQLPIGPSYCGTLAVGSRAAASSVLETVTIVESDASKTLRRSRLYYEQIVVNKSGALQNMGYQVRNATGWYMDQSLIPWEYKSIWDPQTMVLSIEKEPKEFRNRFRDNVELCFEPLWSGHNTKFSIFMCTISSRAIVRGGNAFSKHDKRSFYNLLEHQTSQDDTGNVLIPDREGRLFRISVGIHATKVYDQWLFEVNVDAVQVVADDI
jgi:hypothetical protein